MKYLRPLVGISAFIIGGIVARKKSFEILETVEEFFTKSDS